MVNIKDSSIPNPIMTRISLYPISDIGINDITGRRIKRGLFKTSFGNIINADINAAFNIIRKSAKEAFDVSTLPEGRGFWWNPVRISV
jgi:hypothetical protein